MNVSEKNARIWRKDYEGKNGEYSRYSVGIRNKNPDGTYITYYMPIKFSRKSGAPEKIENGAACDFEGFLSVEAYTNKNGDEVKQPQIIVMKAVFQTESADSFEELEEQIPF